MKALLVFKDGRTRERMVPKPTPFWYEAVAASNSVIRPVFPGLTPLINHILFRLISRSEDFLFYEEA